MNTGLRLGFIPRLRNDGKGIVYENGLGTFAHGAGIGHQSGAGVLHPPTKGFLLALVLAFAFNIYAGMKADGVSFTCCENFSFGKFKNALAELVLYVVIICFLFTGMTANMMRMIFAIFYQSTYIMQRLAKSFF